MKHFFLALLSALLFNTFVYAQGLVGRVFDAESKEPLAGVVVTIRHGESVVAYRATGADGSFSFDTFPDNAKLEARFIGYKAYSADISAGTHTIFLEPEQTVIDAAIIKAEKVSVRGDTISYNVTAIANPADRTLQDLLKRIPGIEVSDKGYVQYNGRSINKFYVEGNDVLDSRYNLVVQNISPENVTTLQILEHHQPVRALEGLVRNESAALNIILNEKVRGQWMAAGEVGGGYADDNGFPVLADAFLSRLSRKSQLMGTAKYDASGRNIIRNNEGFGSDEIVINLEEVDFLSRLRPMDYLQASSVSGSPMGYERVAFNHSLSSSAYTKLPLGENRNMTVSADYEQERLDRGALVKEDYYDAQGAHILSIEEASSGKKNNRLPSLEMRYVRNDTNLYFNDHLRVRNKHSDYLAGKTGADKLDQNLVKNEIEVLNAFSVIWRNSRKTARSFSMLSQFADNDELMRINDAPEGTQSTFDSQNVHSRFLFNRIDFSSNRQFSRGWSMNAHTVLPILIRRFQSVLDSGVLPEENSGNQFDLFSFRPSEELRFQYKTNRFRFSGRETIAVPLVFCSLERKNLSHLEFVTTADGEWQISPGWAAELTLSHDSGSFDEQSLYPFPIMQGYRRISSEPVLKPNPSSFSESVSITGQRPLSGLSFRASLRSQQGKQWLMDRVILGDNGFVWTRRTDEKVPFTMIGALVQLDKAFHDFQHVISFSADASRFSSSLTQDGRVSCYDTDQASARMKWTGNFSDFLTVNWLESISFNRFCVDGVLIEKGIWQASQKASVVYVPFSWLKIENELDGFWNTINRNVVFFWDIHLDFPIKRICIGLHFDNILNHKEYRYRVESPLSSIEIAQPLRPFSAILRFSFNF